LSTLTAKIESEGNNSVPFRVMVYAPLVPVSLAVEFFSSNHSIILVIAGIGGITVPLRTPIGSYSVSDPFSISLDVRVQQSLGLVITNSLTNYVKVFDGREFDPILQSGVRAISVSSLGTTDGGNETSLAITRFEIDIPHNPWVGPKVLDWRIYPLVSFLIGILLVETKELVSSSLRVFRKLARLLAGLPRSLLVVLAAAFLLRLPLFGLGRHPYDIYVEGIWSSVLLKEGLGQLYLRPAVTTAAAAFGGTPYLSAFFPYPPLLAAFFGAAGALNIASLGFVPLEGTIKLLNALADCVGAGVSYFIVRKLGGDHKSGLASATLYGVVPSLIYDSAVWGETDSFLMVFLMLASYLLLTHHDRLFWGSATLGILTKQTALVPIAVMAVIFIAGKGLRKTLLGLGTVASTSIVVLIPFLLSGYSPFILFSQLVQRAFEFTFGQTPFGTPISADAYSFLPLVSGLSGISGRDRMWTSDLNSPGSVSLSYLFLGRALFLGISLPLLIFSLREKRGLLGYRGIALIGVVTFLSFFFPTRVSGRYFVIATALLIPPLVASKRKWAPIIPVVLSLTTFVSMHGLLTYWSKWIPEALQGPAFSNTFSALILSFYLSDIGMNIAIITNFAVMILLLVVLLPHIWLRDSFRAKSS